MTFWNPTEEEVQHAAILILTKTIQLVTEKGMNPVDACKQAPKEIWPNPRIEVAKRGAAQIGRASCRERV